MCVCEGVCILGLLGSGSSPSSVLIGPPGEWGRGLLVVMRLVASWRVLPTRRRGNGTGSSRGPQDAVQRLSLATAARHHGDPILPISPLEEVGAGGV